MLVFGSQSSSIVAMCPGGCKSSWELGACMAALWRALSNEWGALAIGECGSHSTVGVVPQTAPHEMRSLCNHVSEKGLNSCFG